MRKGRFTEEPMVATFREAGRTSVAELARKRKVSEQTVCTWLQKFGSMNPADVKRLRALEHENIKLKRIEREMAIDTLENIWRRQRCTGKPGATRWSSQSSDGTRNAALAS